MKQKECPLLRLNKFIFLAATVYIHEAPDEERVPFSTTFY
jgi:hypothetical protein